MPVKSVTVVDLGERYKAEGLGTGGSKPDLVKRLRVNMRNQEVPPPESEGDTMCDAILVGRSAIGEEEGMQEDARDVLQEALATEELHVENVMGELFVGNLAGLSYANYKVDQAALRARVDIKIASQDFKIASLEDSVSGLKSSLGAYKILRNRFISTFKRDKLGTATEAERRTITEGNGWAHGGDAAVDALLYEGVGGRRDIVAFEKLYGMSPGDVRMISEFFATPEKC